MTFMKNKELLNICYSFFNRFISADMLIEQLSNINRTDLTKNDIKEIEKLIKDIKKYQMILLMKKMNMFYKERKQ